MISPFARSNQHLAHDLIGYAHVKDEGVAIAWPCNRPPIRLPDVGTTASDGLRALNDFSDRQAPDEMQALGLEIADVEDVALSRPIFGYWLDAAYSSGLP